MKVVIILCVLLTVLHCCTSKPKAEIAFKEYWDFDMDRYTLDRAIEESLRKDKPIILWVSYNGNACDNMIVAYQRQSNSVVNYLVDSMVFCRIIVNDKISPRKIKSPQMFSLLGDSLTFKTEGRLNRWICDTYFDQHQFFFIITDPQLRKLSPYRSSADFDSDSLAFLNFMKEGKARYRELHSGTKK